jgi:hypothetical protein
MRDVKPLTHVAQDRTAQYQAILQQLSPPPSLSPSSRGVVVYGVGVEVSQCICGRPAWLWGGISCDVCDRDNDGINDRNEPISSGDGQASKSLFDIPSQGFVVTGFRMQKLIPQQGLSVKMVRRLVETYRGRVAARRAF